MKSEDQWGSELARIRTVRSWGSKAVVLYENAIVHAPRGIAVPVVGASIDVRKGGPTGDVIVATAAFGLVGAIVSQARLYITVSRGGFSFSAYLPGRDAKKVQEFVGKAYERSAALASPPPPLPPPG